MKPPSIKWEEITPKKAKAYLEKNVINRPLREETVLAYQADMTSGNWVPTHQGIAFNDRWELIDGQHRLTAIVRSGATVRMLVTRDLPAMAGETHTMDAVDRGAARSIADQLRLQHGFSNPNFGIAIVAGIASFCLQAKVRKQTTSQVLRALEVYGRHIGELGKQIDTPKHRHFRRTPFAAALVFARAVSPIPVDRFLKSMLTGADLATDSAALTLRNFILSESATNLHVLGTRNERVELSRIVLNALQATIENKPWPKIVGGRTGFIFFAERQKQNLAELAEIYLGESDDLAPDRPGRPQRILPFKPAPPPAVITAKNFKLTPAAAALLNGVEMSQRAHRKSSSLVTSHSSL